MGKLIRLELSSTRTYLLANQVLIGADFKSYKGHHVLLFGDSYFTSIIGPNGSGKSNAMDAISFVLGIKSSHLRSSHLRELLYRGRILKTSKIGENGDAHQTNGDGVNGHVNADAELDEEAPSQTQGNDPKTAWVMAVYEDDAGDELKWKRTITDQGQSEYRINGRAVSAKQYNEALENENILIKARNFLVFQGDVEAIASQSPKDLTRLVEQISGSLEHKADYDRLRDEAEKADEDQHVKFNQRRVINTEIKTYAEQKKEADDYQEKVDERDDAIITHVLWKLYHFQHTIEESGAELARQQEELKEHRREVDRYEQLLDGARKDQAKVARDVTKAEKNIKTAEKNIDDKRNDLLPIDEKIEISNKNIEKYRKRITAVAKERESQSKSAEQLKKALATVEKAQGKWDEDFKKQSKKQGRELNDADIQEYNHLKSVVNKRTANAQIKSDNLNRQQKTVEETVEGLQSKLNDHEAQLVKVQAELEETKERRDTTNEQIKSTTKQVEQKKKEFNTMTSERLRIEQRRTEMDEKLQEVLQRLFEANHGRRQSEREQRSKETVTAMKRIFPGVRGRIHELCKPKQKKFETAVSTALGRHFDSIVVDTEKTAKDCISYLREQRAGQATFIPLETIQVKAIDTSLKGMHDKMRLAIDTVTFDDPATERAILYACGNAMICDDLVTARYLCFDKRVEAKAVTLDGTVIHKGGLMTGGRGQQDKNARKWDDAEVQNLDRLRDKLMAEINALPRAHDTAASEETLRSDLFGLEQSLASSKEEAKALEKNLASKKKEADFGQKTLKEVRPKLKEQSDALEKVQGQIDVCQKEIASVEDEVYQSFCQRLKYDNIRAYEDQQGTLQQEAAQKKLEFTMQKSKLENQLTFETKRLQTTSNRVKSLEEQSRRDADLIVSLEEEKQAMQEELDTLGKQLDKLNAAVEAHKANHQKQAELVSTQRRELQKRTKDTEHVTKTITGLEAEVQRNAASKTTLLRKCKIDQIDIPLAEGSAALDDLPVDEAAADQDRMEVDEDPDTTMQMEPLQDYGIVVDFEDLDDDLKAVS